MGGPGMSTRPLRPGQAARACSGRGRGCPGRERDRGTARRARRGGARSRSPADRAWKDRRRAADGVAKVSEQRDVGVGVSPRIRRAEPHCKRSESRARSAMVDREHGDAHATERADRRQAVDKGRVADDGRWLGAGAGVGRNAIAVQRRPATHHHPDSRQPPGPRTDHIQTQHRFVRQAPLDERSDLAGAHDQRRRCHDTCGARPPLHPVREHVT